MNPEIDGIPRLCRGDAIGDTMYSERWILRLLMRLTKLLSDEEEFTSELETALCSLWDMCAEKDVIIFTRKHGLITLAVNAIMKSKSPRLSEILVGIIGNMCTLKSVREECKSRADVARVIMELLAFTHCPTLIQVMRVLQTFAWEVTHNSSASPQGRNSEDGGEFDNDHQEDDHHDYDNNVGPVLDLSDGEGEREVEDDNGFRSASGSSNDKNVSKDAVIDSSEESSLSDNMEEGDESTVPACGNQIARSGAGTSYVGDTHEEKTDEISKFMIREELRESIMFSLSSSMIVESQGVIEENMDDEQFDQLGPIIQVEEMIISLASDSSDENEDEEIEANYVPGPSNIANAISPTVGVAGPSGAAVGPSLGRGGNVETCGGGEGSRGGNDRNALDLGPTLYDDHDDDENPEVVFARVGDNSVIPSSTTLWYDLFVHSERWLPEVVFILTSSKNAELLGVTWSLLSVLCYIKVGNSYLCGRITGPDLMRGLLESHKEFFAQHTDYDNLEIHNTTRCRKGLLAWTSIMYSFTFHKDCKKVCCVYKAEIMKTIFEMLPFFDHFLPVDGDLSVYLIHTFSVLDHILRIRPFELSRLRSAVNGVTQLLDELTEEKRRQEGNDENPHYEEDAINCAEQYLMNVLNWLNRLHSIDRLRGYEDVREELTAKFSKPLSY